MAIAGQIAKTRSLTINACFRRETEIMFVNGIKYVYTLPACICTRSIGAYIGRFRRKRMMLAKHKYFGIWTFIKAGTGWNRAEVETKGEQEYG